MRAEARWLSFEMRATGLPEAEDRFQIQARTTNFPNVLRFKVDVNVVPAWLDADDHCFVCHGYAEELSPVLEPDVHHVVIVAMW